MRKVIYLDHSATTPVRKEVLTAMKPFWTESFGNPGSITKIGVKARTAVEASRRKIAEILKARPQEIIFTSGGTESNNLAIFGLVNHLNLTPALSLEKERGKKISDMHFITTNIEHSSVTECFKELERRGAGVDYLAVNEKGLVEPRDLRKIIKPNTVLVSVGYANNEIGTIQPIKEIAKEIRHARKSHKSLAFGTHKDLAFVSDSLPLFHTDASQAGLFCNLNLNELGVDLLTLDAQKIYGPKGVGLLYRRAGVEIAPIIFGGGQEGGLRSGTENVPGIVGFCKALELCRQGAASLPSVEGRVRERLSGVEKLRDYFYQKIQKEIPSAILNGDLENRLPNNLNISIPGIDSEFTVLCLDEAGIVCSTRSACGHGTDGSLVIRALYKGLTFEGETFARSSLRFSLGEDITKKEIDFVVSTLKNLISRVIIGS